jgi:hypothetical protein
MREGDRFVPLFLVRGGVPHEAGTDSRLRRARLLAGSHRLKWRIIPPVEMVPLTPGVE